MTRSVLQPIRSRRIVRPTQPAPDPAARTTKLSPATRKTIAAIGALMVSFGVNASATPSDLGAWRSAA